MLTLQGTDIAAFEGLAQQPRTLHVAGEDLEALLTKPRIGVVGTRTPTSYGIAVTKMLVTELTKQGIVVVSGLALGIDSIAHQACLEVGGQTIAVLPSGLGNIYPRSHQKLAKQIVENEGTLVSEYEHSETPYKHYFIARNRIIAALSDGLLVIEAAEKSGSLHTADFALELGKPVFAVPGNITSPLSAGCNELIRNGAVPVTSVQDIFEELGWRQS